MKLLIYTSLVALLCCDSAAAEVVSVTKHVHGAGTIRYHYDTNSSRPSCHTVMILGVGTAMSVSDYDLISHEIVNSNIIMPIVVDPEPDWFIKTSAERFAKLANVLVGQIKDTISVCATTSTPKVIIVGGHSAGGQAAMEALPLFDFVPKGFLGLDPYEIDQTDQPLNHHPALFWGFAETTCGVDVNKAAKAGYDISDESHRILYQIQHNKDNHNTHCIFTDNGCCACPDSMSFDQQERLLALVGESTKRFVHAIQHGSFSREEFELNGEDVIVRLFVNQDNVDHDVESLQQETKVQL